MSTPIPKQKTLDELYGQIAALTAPKCASCRVPNSCCDAMYCEMAIDFAAKRGVTLARTDHPKYPLMGPKGCTAAPHFRPICSVHVCEMHYASNIKFSRKYFALREKIDEMEWGLDEEKTNQAGVGPNQTENTKAKAEGLPAFDDR